MFSSTFYAGLDRSCARMETNGNYIDWIPCLRVYSAAVRFVAGKIQLFVGGLFFILKSLEFILTWDVQARFEAREGLQQAVHGAFNIARSTMALVPYFNVLCILYDLQVGRFNYIRERVPFTVYPLNPLTEAQPAV